MKSDFTATPAGVLADTRSPALQLHEECLLQLARIGVLLDQVPVYAARGVTVAGLAAVRAYLLAAENALHRVQRGEQPCTG